MAWGLVVPRNTARAIELTHRAAELGVAKSQYDLGLVYLNGAGAEKSSAQAAKWFTKAAKQNHIEALLALAVCYLNGDGVPKDTQRVIELTRKAAELGNMEAQGRYASIYFDGQFAPIDYAKAAKWYRKAAEQGSAAAQTNLGHHVSYGPGRCQRLYRSQKVDDEGGGARPTRSRKPLGVNVHQWVWGAQKTQRKLMNGSKNPLKRAMPRLSSIWL